MIYRQNKWLRPARRPGAQLFFPLAAAILAGFFSGGCGYRVGASPYQLSEPLAVRVPIAQNKTPNSGLAATLTNLMVEELTSSPQITVIGPGLDSGPEAADQAVLQLTITHLKLEGGAWEVEDGDNTFSVSRRVTLTVEGLLTRKGPDGRSRPPIRRSVTANRAYLVINDQTQLETNQAYATHLALAEAVQKLALVMFSDF